MGCVYRRNDTGIWWLKFKLGKKTMRMSSKTKNKVTARRILHQKEGEAEKGIFIPATMNEITYVEAVDAVITDYEIHGKRSVDGVKRRDRLHLRPVFGARRLAAITANDVTKYMAARQTAGASNGEINRELALLRRAFNLAIKRKELVPEAKPDFTMLPEADPREGFLEDEQVEAVRAHLPAGLRPVVTFAYLTGWRIAAEVLTLQWKCVDFATGLVRLEAEHSKNKTARVVPIPAGTPLRALLDEQWAEHERLAKKGRIVPHVFHRSGKEIKDLRASWDNACTAAGVPGRLLHDLRRSAVRNMVRSGTPEAVVMKVTGHKSRSAFDRYNIVSEADLVEAVKRMGTVLGTVGPKTASSGTIGTAKKFGVSL